MRKTANSKGRKGAEILEFTLSFLPLLMMTFVLLDAAWAIFVKSTLAYAVRTGVRQGITITGAQAAGTDLTTMVKTTVQNNSMGLLRGTAGYNLIKVNYIQPPSASSSGASLDVSDQIDGNKSMNIMQVSIQGFTLGPLMPRIFGLRTPIDSAGTTIAAVAADLIEPSRDPPNKGNAP